jgi:hypothetical protein
MMMKEFPRVLLKDSQVIVERGGSQQCYPCRSLPQDFIDWQVSQRVVLFDALRRQQQPSFFLPHLPVVISRNVENQAFPIHVTCKGVGLVALDSYMDFLSGHFEAIMGSEKGKSIEERVRGALMLYGCPELIHRSCLGGIEIFEGQTFRNIINDPRVSLFYVGTSPNYVSYQIDCIAEIVPKGRPFYRFMLAMRGLFEDFGFHFQQPEYPFAIRYHVLSVLDTSLKVRSMNPGDRSTSHV